MKFNEAMQLLEKGKKVTRNPWLGSIYFMMEDNDIKCYQPKLQPYIYNENIMVSDGWMVEGVEGEFKFYDIIDQLQAGKKCHLKEWKETYIYLDRSIKTLVIHSMEVFPFAIDFAAFMAQDWVGVI